MGRCSVSENSRAWSVPAFLRRNCLYPNLFLHLHQDLPAPRPERCPAPFVCLNGFIDVKGDVVVGGVRFAGFHPCSVVSGIGHHDRHAFVVASLSKVQPIVWRWLRGGKRLTSSPFSQFFWWPSCSCFAVLFKTEVTQGSSICYGLCSGKADT